VALEVSRGRTTTARTETCSTDDAQPCFDGVDVGDKFIRRELNEPCDRLVSWSVGQLVSWSLVRWLCAYKTRLILQLGIADRRPVLAVILYDSQSDDEKN